MQNSKEMFGANIDINKVKDELTDILLMEKGYDSILKQRIIKRDDSKQTGLSFAQKRMWFMNQINPDNPVNNMPLYLTIKGRLNIEALKKALEQILLRHDSLRTRFKIIDNEPRHEISKIASGILSLIDLRNLEKTIMETERQRIVLEEFLLPFDLENDFMLRTKLLLLENDENVLLITLHHIASDFWSIKIFQNELVELYSAFSKNDPSPLPDLPIQYEDFVIWQNEWMTGSEAVSQLSYWKEKLEGIEPLFIPIDYKRPAIQTYRGNSMPVFIKSDVVEKLRSIGHDNDATLYMVLLAAFSVLLFRYSGHEDVAVGTGISNRNRKEIKNLIGFFVNTLVMRNDLSGNPTFSELMDKVRVTALDAYANQDLPFDHLVSELQPERDMSRNPLAQIGFALQNAPISSFDMHDLHVTNMTLVPQSVRYDMELHLWEIPKGMGGYILYAKDLFKSSTIPRIITHFINLLKEISGNPNKRISELLMLSKEETSVILDEWNKTDVEYPGDKCVHELYEEQVEKTPNALAVTFEDKHITYKELNRKANQLAHYLRNNCVGPESIVAIMDDHTIDMIISILGILKAGAAYFPIDLQNPVDRNHVILDDSKANVILTRSGIIKDIPFHWLQNLQNIKEQVIVTPKRQPILDLDMLPIPDRSLVDYEKYDRYIGEGPCMKCMSILASRGCPYNCLYCHMIWPKKHVFRSAQNIFQEIKYHYENGYDTFNILDDIFNLDKKNSEKFFNLIIKNKMKIRLLFPTGLRGDLLTPDYIDLMSEAGVIQMALALETASPRLQKLIRKNLDIEKLRENLLYICKKHPHIMIDLFTMFGFPTETEEEALMTLDFIFGIKWLHFPQLHALKIFPNTGMATLAMKNGISKDVIEKSSDSAYHDVSDTMPFSKSFSRKFQSKYLYEYFLNSDRLHYVIPIQKKLLTHEELIMKYNNYVPGGIENYQELLELIGSDDINSKDNKIKEYGENREIINLHEEKIKDNEIETNNKLKVLLLDLSQHFSSNSHLLSDLVEAPLGLIYLMTYLRREFGQNVDGKIAKAMIDFDNYDELKILINEIQPQVIGIRTLSLYKNFFHETISKIKSWLPDVPIIAGGPYATSDYPMILSDSNVDVIVIGEGEITFSELIDKMIINEGRLPEDEILKTIPGLAFVPKENKTELSNMDLGRKIILLDEIEDELSKGEEYNTLNLNYSDEAAYLMYTSGSTGLPKGISVPHKAINRLVKNQNYIDIKSEDIIAQAANISFDAATFELWGALLNGSKLNIFRRDIILSPERFSSALVTHEISILFLTTALFNQITEYNADSFRNIKYFMFGGEAVDPKSVRKILQNIPPLNFLHVYGPTENTTFSSWFSISEVSENAVTVPIGKPISNTQIYVLDHYLTPVPIGVNGELFIKGVGLAHGYFRKPGLTADYFRPSPLSNDYGIRIYKSGDLVRYKETGDIEFIDRVDHQVKIRGYRIELGEIESILLKHPSVRDCTVLASEGHRGDKRLVGYVVPDYESTTDIAELKSYLKEQLPGYMVPSSLMFIEKLPLTTNGKVDRKMLPVPDGSELIKKYTPPQNEVEQCLVIIWQDVLDMEKIGIHDNFFDIGGHSLLATHVVSRLRNIFSIDLSLSDMFKAQSISEFSKIIYRFEDDKKIITECANLFNKVETMPTDGIRQMIQLKENYID